MSDAPTATPAAPALPAWRIAVVTGASALPLLLILLHVDGINGSPYHTWDWQRLPPAAWLWTAAGAAPITGVWWLLRRGARDALLLPALALAALAMQFAAAAAHPPHRPLERMMRVVDDRGVSGYFTTAPLLAAAETRAFFESYPRQMASFYLHQKQKPPGPLVYHAGFVDALARDEAGRLTRARLPDALRAATVGMLLVASSVPLAAWLLTRAMTGDRETARLAGLLMCAAPALAQIAPMFDQWHAWWTALLTATWLAALRRRSFTLAALFGLTLFLATFMTYLVLPLGAMILALGLHAVAARRNRAVDVAALAAAGVAVAAGAYLLLHLALGFDPIATFLAALGNQRAIERIFIVPRPWPDTIPTDLLDFAMGAGYAPAALAALALTRPALRAHPALLAALGQIAVVALSGLIRCETARVWMFLQPLLMLAAAMELRHWPPAWRALPVALMALVGGAAGQNFTFFAFSPP